ncbi:phosphotransferase family protein [Paenibacillus sp. sgz500958]|uniref:phosphotransferase family protein n=1 Tax=Paenibacillus sp. sgz500958 TaxID=3242475 RepID=UPI0036D4045A
MTKTKLTAEQQILLVQSAFGSQIKIDECTELTGGYFNAAYCLRLSDGRLTILKIAPAQDVEILSYERNIMEAEVGALRLVKSKGNIPVPEVYFYDNSHEVFPADYFFMEYVEGEPYNEIKEKLSMAERAAIEAELGRYSALINEIEGQRFGMFSESSLLTGDTWSEAFMRLMTHLLDDARRLKAKLPVSYEVIEREIASRIHVLDEVTVPKLVHWDLWDGNVFVRDGKIVALIDWERALWGDHLMEYYFRHIENSEAFYEGYGGKFDLPNDQSRKRLYDLYIDLIYFIEFYSRKYNSEGHLQWAHDNLVEGWARFTADAE